MTELTCPQKFRLLSTLTIVIVAQAPLPGYTEGSSTQPSQAVVPELELIKEEETVSIASRYEQPISQSPANVYVITDEDIRQSGATDLPTVLRRIPGVDVMQTTGADINVSIRGNNQLLANKLLVMVDGRSIYIDGSGTVYWKLIPVTLPEIKRIEVLKGPASSIYGFNAFDGVINIITKSPEEMKGTTLQFGGGNYGTISSAAIQAGTQGKFGYRLSVGHDQNQQWRNSDALAFRANKFNVQTEYALSTEDKVHLAGGLVDSNRFDGPLSEVTAPAETPAQGYADIGYERRNAIIRAWWMNLSDTNDQQTNALLAPFLGITDRSGSLAQKNRGNTYNIDLQHSLDFGTSNRLTYGANYRHNMFSSNILASFTSEDRLGLFVQNEWKATKSLAMVAGLRYDLDTFINPTLSPRVTLLYQPAEDHTLQASISMAYRPPNIFETNLEVQNRVAIGPVTTTFPAVGSQNLSPEQIVSYQLGYQGWFLRHRLRARVDLFFNHLSNLIAFRADQPGLAATVTAMNAGVADIYGGEAGIEFLMTKWLSGFANVSYQDFGQTFGGFSRRGMPHWKTNAGLRGEWDNGVSGEAAFHYVDAATYPIGQAFFSFAPLFPPGVSPPNERVDSYTLVNLRGAYRFWQQKAEAGYMRDAEVAVSAFNALNDRHKEYPLGDTIGSRVMAWLTVRY
jgi:iron complex outermembrane receptor protein